MFHFMCSVQLHVLLYFICGEGDFLLGLQHAGVTTPNLPGCQWALSLSLSLFTKPCSCWGGYLVSCI